MKGIKLVSGMPKITFLTHIYYPHTFELFKEQLSAFRKYNANYLFNISRDCLQKDEINSEIKKELPGAFIIETPNIGKDIGGKLALIDLYLKLNFQSDYLVLLHDKLSPHTSLGTNWRNKLFRVIEPENTELILSLFDNDKRVGIVSAKEFITNEYDKKNSTFVCTSASILTELIQEFSFNLSTHDFVGGTMFWIKAELVQSFFTKNPPLNIRATLEKRNILDHARGSVTHAWERMFSWITINQGYIIKGI